MPAPTSHVFARRRRRESFLRASAVLSFPVKQNTRIRTFFCSNLPALLLPGMRESFTSDVLVKDIRPPVFSALLTYIYTDTLQLEKPEDIMELLVVANQV